MTPKVSIILPVHNAGEALKKCIESLLNQTMKNIEIVVVLDKPTDGSDIVAKKYATNDNRIVIVENVENLHIGLSRNEGIKFSKGEYIGFCDHDDYCSLNMFEEMYTKAKLDQADIVVSNFCDEWPNETAYFNFPEVNDNKTFQKKMFEALIEGKYSQKNSTAFNNANVIWNQIFRREFILENNLWLCDNRLITMEDVLFNIKCHFLAKNVSFIPKVYYHHVNHLSNTFEKYEYRSISRTIPHLNEIYNFLNQQDIYSAHKQSFARCTLRRLYTSFRNELKFMPISSLMPFFRLINQNKFLINILNELKINPKLLSDFGLSKKLFLKFVLKLN